MEPNGYGVKDKTQIRSANVLISALANKNRTLASDIYETEVQRKTINPEWNQRFGL